jgi:arginyl-tRNA synthetase
MAEDARRINVEFVSANPTGPLHVGNARGAFVGDVLARVLTAAGHEVEREYYFNDFGAQVVNLGLSVLARRRGTEVPEDGYRGAYVDDLAAELPEDVLTVAESDPGEAGMTVGRWASERIRAGIESSLEHLGVHYDVWREEGSLHRDGWVARAVDRLRQSGHIYESDGATWFTSTDYGDDKDRVVYRSNGQPTYFASDIGYVAEKFSRGFDELIYIWGADHHGTVARVRNAAEAMGFDRDAVRMILVAWVRFVRDGVEIPMSKRSGEFITLDEVLAEVGVDAARWFFSSRAFTTGIDFDLELAKKQSNENPVYYVQYAHARAASILRHAAELGVGADATRTGELLVHPSEHALVRHLLELPDTVATAAERRETHEVPRYAYELATAFSAFYRDCKVLGEDADLTAARLALVAATRSVIANALDLLGISAPDSM